MHFVCSACVMFLSTNKFWPRSHQSPQHRGNPIWRRQFFTRAKRTVGWPFETDFRSTSWPGYGGPVATSSGNYCRTDTRKPVLARTLITETSDGVLHWIDYNYYSLLMSWSTRGWTGRRMTPSWPQEALVSVPESGLLEAVVDTGKFKSNSASTNSAYLTEPKAHCPVTRVLSPVGTRLSTI